MAGDFGEGITNLINQVGEGPLKGSLEVDQIYAHRQHEETGWKHPRGGTDHYLQKPLFGRLSSYMKHLADHVVESDGRSGLVNAMADNMEDLSGQVEILAPLDLNNLRRSGHPTVTDDGVLVFDRVPKQARLTEEELRELRKAHNAAD